MSTRTTESTPKIDPPTIEKNGTILSVSFDGNPERSLFHAPWLWSNDAQNFHSTSGQKKASPGKYDGSVLASARVEKRLDLEEHGRTLSRMPRRGGIHPLNVILPDDEQEIDEETQEDSWVVVITWENGKKTVYDLEWLRKWAYDGTSLNQGRQSREVTPQTTFVQKFLRPEEEGVDSKVVRWKQYKGLRHVEYGDFVSQDKKGIYNALDAIFQDGAVIVRNADTHGTVQDPEETVTIIGKALGGHLSHGSLYGNVFHVKAEKNSNNIAYTSEHLVPHQDLAYYESKPGFQLLHCLDDGGPPRMEGGESILVDCMAAAHRFRELAPDLFHTLTTCNATFVKERKGACMTYLRPHIQLLESRHGCHQNDTDAEIVAVHWSPPFEGPLHIPSNLVEEYYRAYAAFEVMVDCMTRPSISSRAKTFHLDESLLVQLSDYAIDYTWNYRLRPGEVLVFNNTRLLHGRHSFQSRSGTSSAEIDQRDEGRVRHLVGAYTNIDDSLNVYRTILQEMAIQQQQVLNVGNGTSSVIP